MIASGGSVDVAVIGGGISGLVAAYRLQQAGRVVALVDGGRAPGGVIASHRDDGYLYETGPNSTLDTTPLIDSLLDDLAIRDQRVDAASTAKQRYVIRDGRLAALPASPAGLIATRAFTPAAKLRLLREPWIPRAPADAEESIAAFVRRRLGDEFLDYAIDPFVSGIYAGDPESISVRAAFPRLFALEQKHGSLLRGQVAGARERRANPETSKHAAKSFSFRAGMQTLPDAIAARLAHRFADTRVGEIARRGDGGFSLRANGFSLHARALVLAVPAHAAAPLVEPLAPMGAKVLRSIRYAPVAVVASGYRRADVAHDLAGFGFLVPRRERRTILGSLFSSSLFPGRAPADHVLFTSFIGGEREPDAAALDPPALEQRAGRELEALVGARSPRWTRVVRWPQAIPQYTIGHLERVAAFDDASAHLGGLFTCANWRGGVAVGDCIRNAHEVAARVDAWLAAPTAR